MDVATIIGAARERAQAIRRAAADVREAARMGAIETNVAGVLAAIRRCMGRE